MRCAYAPNDPPPPARPPRLARPPRNYLPETQYRDSSDLPLRNRLPGGWGGGGCESRALPWLPRLFAGKVGREKVGREKLKVGEESLYGQREPQQHRGLIWGSNKRYSCAHVLGFLQERWAGKMWARKVGREHSKWGISHKSVHERMFERVHKNMFNSVHKN